MAAAAKIEAEPASAPIADSPERRPMLTLVPPAPPPPLRLRCRWEYKPDEKRIVQVWELRP